MDEYQGFVGYSMTNLAEPEFMLIDFTVPPFEQHGPFALNMQTGEMVGDGCDWPPDAEQMMVCQVYRHAGRAFFKGAVIDVKGMLCRIAGQTEDYLVCRDQENMLQRIKITDEEAFYPSTLYVKSEDVKIVGNIYQYEVDPI